MNTTPTGNCCDTCSSKTWDNPHYCPCHTSPTDWREELKWLEESDENGYQQVLDIVESEIASAIERTKLEVIEITKKMPRRTLYVGRPEYPADFICLQDIPDYLSPSQSE